MVIQLLKEYFIGIYKHRYVLTSLINVDLQSKYRKSVLGVLWSILTPLGISIIIGAVYSIIFNNDPTMFIPMLFAGLNPWIFINTCADGGTFAFLNAEGYIKQTTVDVQIYPVRMVTVAFINLLYSVIAFFSLYLFLQPELFSVQMLMVIPGLLLIYIFCLGVTNTVSIINLCIRDYQPMQSIILQGLFYVTPVIFESSMLAEKGFSLVYELNPLYYMLIVVKKPMLGNGLPEPREYVIALVIALVMFFVGVFAVMKNKKNIAYKL